MINPTTYKKYIFISIGILVSLYGILLFTWFLKDPTINFEENNPGLDKRNISPEKFKEELVKIGDKFQKFTDYKSDLKGCWPQFRGTNSDNIVKTNIQLNENWSAKIPHIVWSVELGDGHAAPAIYDGLIYILDYDEKEKADALRCFSLIEGKEIWKRWYKVKIKRNHGRSRTIPFVNDKYILTIGPRCHVMCMDRLSGNLLWTIDLEKQYNVETPFWYTGQCPQIINDIAIIAPGGKALMIGVDCQTGKVLWETPNLKNWKMSHACVTATIFCGKKIFVYPAIGGLCGIAADGNDAGKILWEYELWTPSVIAPTAIAIGKDRILFTAGYGAGSLVLKIENQGDKFIVNKISKLSPSEGISSEQQTPILYNGLIYSIQPKDAGVLKNQLVCYSPDDCRKPIWSSGKTSRFGLGPYMIINDIFFILNDDGTLTMAKASKKEYIQLAQKKLFEGEDAWGPMAFADGYLLLRDSKKLYCIDLKK